MQIRFGKICRCLLAAAFCALLAACGHQSLERSLVKVEVERVEPTQVARTITLTGEIRARVESELGFRVGGRINKRLVEVGDHVAAGQVLATLDAHEQHALVEESEAQVRAAEARLRNETSQLERQKFLLSRKSTPQSEYDRAEESFRTAQGAFAAAKAQLATARDALAQTELRADSTGTITARKAEVGEVVAGGQSVFDLAHDGPRDAVFNVSDSTLRDQGGNRNLAIEVKLLSDPAVRATGKVREVTPTLSGDGGTVAVKVGLDNTPPAMSLGAAVSGDAPLRPRQAMAIPPNALASVAGQPCVWVVDPSTREVSARSITIARYQTDRVIVASGLRAGELVVTRAGQKMSPNQIVAIAELR